MVGRSASSRSGLAFLDLLMAVLGRALDDFLGLPAIFLNFFQNFFLVAYAFLLLSL